MLDLHHIIYGSAPDEILGFVRRFILRVAEIKDARLDPRQVHVRRTRRNHVGSSTTDCLANRNKKRQAVLTVTYLISFNMFPQVSKVKATLIISPTEAKPLLIGTLPWRGSWPRDVPYGGFLSHGVPQVIIQFLICSIKKS